MMNQTKQHKAPEISEDAYDVADKQELVSEGFDLDANDPNFQSELAYDGYRSIAEYDNGAYNSDVENGDDKDGELTIEDREEDADMAEENLVDPQENRK